MSILSCKGISLAYGTDVILEDVSFSVNAGTKLGIIGVNGAGKSTLLKILSGELSCDKGSFSVANGVQIGRLEQYTDSSFDGLTVADVAFNKFAELVSLERSLNDAEALLHTGNSADVDRYTALREEFYLKGGYEYKSKVMSLMKKLGFSDGDMEKNASTLSGGQKTKLSLAALLMKSPDIILLDEPTNHLDLQATVWLEDQIRASSSTFIIVSHDRYFLDRTTTDTLELQNGRSVLYSGSYSVFKEKQKKIDEDKSKHYQLQQKEIARLEAFIANQRKWNRERNIIAAESRMKAIDRMDKLAKPESAPNKIDIAISSDKKSSYDVLSVRSLGKAFGNKKLFSDLSFEVKRSDRLFILGPNGSGKSTLLKILNRNLATDKGAFEYGYNITPGYYDQEQMLLNHSNTVILELWNSYPDFTQTELRKALASYGFKGDNVFKNVCDLSGGEKARLAIAKLVLSGSNLLILDEPTNYLDINSKEVLENALNDYKGTLVCVSHDRYLVSKLSTKILDMDSRYSSGYCIYNCGYDDYLRNKANFSNNEQKENKQSEGAAEFYSKKKEAGDKRRLEKKKLRLEKEIEDTEKLIKELDLSASENSTDYIKLSQIESEKVTLNETLDDLYEELLEII